MKDGVMARNSKKRALPENMTVEEASEFFDEHSLLEFDGTEEVDVKFKLKKKHYVGIDREVFKKLEAQARRQKLSVEALLENLITERI
jgi:predicted HicB family RNase H-like nuclease